MANPIVAQPLASSQPLSVELEELLSQPGAEEYEEIVELLLDAWDGPLDALWDYLQAVRQASELGFIDQADRDIILQMFQEELGCTLGGGLPAGSAREPDELFLWG